MRILQSSVFRALCAIVFGYLLVIYRNQMLHWTTIAFGALFFLSGLVSVIAYYAEKRRAANMAERLSAMSEMRGKEMETPSEDSIRHSLMPGFPIVGIGSMVLGVILAIMPTTFIHGMMYVIAGLLVLGALNMMFNLSMARKFASIGLGFWIMPLLLLVLGVLMIAKPDLFAAMPFRILGWALIVYGVIECINAIKIHNCRKQYEKIQAAQQAASKAEIEDAVIVEDNLPSSTI
jgi:uncharacterized membrane protein HdeD (DUF308 family)